MIDAEAEQLREALPADVAAARGRRPRHGRLAGRSAGSTSTTHPELRDGVALLGGEARFRHLYCRRGAVDDVAATWRAVLGRPGRGAHPRRGDRARLVRPGRRPACARGSATSSSPARGDSAVISSTDFPYEAQLVGLHGSLTPDEMLIPLLVD